MSNILPIQESFDCSRGISGHNTVDSKHEQRPISFLLFDVFLTSVIIIIFKSLDTKR